MAIKNLTTNLLNFIKYVIKIENENEITDANIGFIGIFSRYSGKDGTW